MSQQIRVATGTILLFIAGAFVSLEVFSGLAFLSNGRSLAEQAWSLHRFVVCAFASLAVAAAVCPFNRPLALGRAMLIGAVFPLIPLVSVYGSVDWRLRTWQIGLANLIIVGGTGLLLFRRGGGKLRVAFGRA